MEPLKAVKTSRMGRRALLLIGIGVVSAGSVAGVSFGLTSSSGPTAAPAATASHPRARRPRRGSARGGGDPAQDGSRRHRAVHQERVRHL